MPKVQSREQNEQDMLKMFRRLGFKRQCMVIGRLQAMLEREGDSVPSSDATKYLPPQVQDVNGYLGRMEDVYDRLVVAHSSMVIIQCASEYGDPMTLQEIPFAIEEADIKLHTAADDLDMLCREVRKEVNNYIKGKEE